MKAPEADAEDPATLPLEQGGREPGDRHRWSDRQHLDGGSSEHAGTGDSAGCESHRLHQLTAARSLSLPPLLRGGRAVADVDLVRRADPAVGVRSRADGVVCLAQPDDLQSIGRFYGDFSATSDAEVLTLLENSKDAGEIKRPHTEEHHG